MARHNKALEAAKQRAEGVAAPPVGSEPPREAAAPATHSPRVKGLVALATVFVLAVAAFITLPLLFPEEELETVEYDLLLGVTEDEITGISWVYEDETIEVSLEDETWVLPDDTEAELDQDSVSDIATTLAEADVARSIDADAETDEMGLSEPQIEASITLADGSTISFSIGAYDDSEGYTYVTTSESDTISLVDYNLITALSVELSQLYATESAINASQVDSLTVEHDGQTLLLTYIEDGSEELSYTLDYEWFVGEDESSLTPISDTTASQLTTVVNNVSWEYVVDPHDDGTTDYGFDNPTLTATMDYTTYESVSTGETDEDGEEVYETQEVTGAYTLIVGDQAEDGTYYAQPEGSSIVYAIAAEDVETLLAASVEDLLPDDVLLMDWDTVDSIDVTYGEESFTIEIVREEVENEDEDSEDDSSEEIETSYFIDGEEADADDIEALLDALDDLSAESEASGEATENSFEVSFTFHRNTSAFTEMTLGLTRYDNSFYLVSFNDQERLLINRNDVTDLEELIEALL